MKCETINPYHPNPEKIDDFDVACSIGHKQIITEKSFFKDFIKKTIFVSLKSWRAGAGAGEPEPELVDMCLIAPELEPELVNEYLIAPELEPELVLFYSGSPALVSLSKLVFFKLIWA